MPRRTVAEVFPPGEFIREELEARDWTQSDLARILGRPLQAVNMIINGRKAITPETAIELAAAFGTSAELWMNLETAYRLRHSRAADPGISKRAMTMLQGNAKPLMRYAASSKKAAPKRPRPKR